MLYSNNSHDAVIAMEQARTGYYGEDYYAREYEECPVCGQHEPYCFYLDINDECVGCSEYVTEVDALSLTQ